MIAMCFGGSKTPRPEPTYPVRFAYNQPVPNTSDTQQKQVAAANTNTQPAFGSDLGTTQTPTMLGTGY
jgi:hypothetical protein